MTKNISWTEEQLRAAVKENYSLASVIKALGLIPAGGNYKIIKAWIKRLDIDNSHFTGQGHMKGKTHDHSRKMSLNEILVKGSSFQSFKLKKRLIKAGLKTNVCELCGLEKWLGKPIAMHLDHKNGDNTDNRLENLQLICPNCHSQTETYAGKNKGKNK